MNPESRDDRPVRPRVLVTGATRGIGRGVVDTLSPAYDVVVAGRRSTDIRAVAAQTGAAASLVIDLAEPAALAVACQDLGEVDAVVHCAGIEGTAVAADLGPDFFSRVLAVNLAGPVELTRLTLPGLRRRRGHVVFVNSTAALGAFSGWGAYAASKAGLRAYADVLRTDERPHGVRVTSVFPGRTDTGMQRDIAAKLGTMFDAATAMPPSSVASAVRYVLDAPADAEIGELTISPVPVA
ncbi:SDR family oxidoreductase [Georgenia halophila]|uniref:SDR family oxidoreductase n=1 Tax=Georgenia halophila TaxID=620889 RepID=A0ABP8KTN5_9MICO